MKKSKELTPIQEAKKQIAELWSSPSDQPTYSQIFEILEELLPKEKQVIEKCCIDMVNLSITKMENKDFEKGMEQEFNDYYNTK